MWGRPAVSAVINSSRNYHNKYAVFSSALADPLWPSTLNERSLTNARTLTMTTTMTMTRTTINGFGPMVSPSFAGLGGTVRTLIVPPVAGYRREKKRMPMRYRRRPAPIRIANGKKPKMDSARQFLPLGVEEMDNSSLIVLGELGELSARKEILKRHIMERDRVTYEEACKTFEEIAMRNQEGQYLLSFPYKIGIVAALTAAFSSFPLCFDITTAEWFNKNFVTTDVPNSEDLETWLEVGAWTWNWMEPPLGQISFFLLCLQFSRSQLENLGIKPYTQRIKRWRAEHLVSLYPQYDSRVLMNYSESSGMVSGTH